MLADYRNRRTVATLAGRAPREASGLKLRERLKVVAASLER
jgi:hypothetical protein